MALFSHSYVSLPEIADYIYRKNLKIYLAETNSVISNSLKRQLKAGLLVCSEYFGLDYEGGEAVRGILHQDLQHTSFDDETFDIIITSDVIEHIPNAIAAEKEVMRISKPGGVYCFTISLLQRPNMTAFSPKWMRKGMCVILPSLNSMEID
jgi:SAM-dependent methyltransferase